jgi:hypothetical protein
VAVDKAVRALEGAAVRQGDAVAVLIGEQASIGKLVAALRAVDEAVFDALGTGGLVAVVDESAGAGYWKAERVHAVGGKRISGKAPEEAVGDARAAVKVAVVVQDAIAEKIVGDADVRAAGCAVGAPVVVLIEAATARARELGHLWPIRSGEGHAGGHVDRVGNVHHGILGATHLLLLLTVVALAVVDVDIGLEAAAGILRAGKVIFGEVEAFRGAVAREPAIAMALTGRKAVAPAGVVKRDAPKGILGR